VRVFLQHHANCQQLYTPLSLLSHSVPTFEHVAGMAYAIYCDILDITPSLSSGQTITDSQLGHLQEQATAKAVSTGRQGDAAFAPALIALTFTRVTWAWQVMPDLITMLTAASFEPEDDDDDGGSSDSSSIVSSWLQGLSKLTGKSAFQTANNWVSGKLRDTVIKLLVYSCTKPDTALDVSDIKITALTCEMLCVQ
jgi:hypothetical protein